MIKEFFIFCSGVHPSFLKRSPADTNKYVGIGATIFFTGLLAFFSSAYAFYTVFDSITASLALGVIWGLMIFNLDRYIVSSIKKTGSAWNQFTMAFPRLLFAVIFALVISKPLEMKLFESEINSEIVSMQQSTYKQQEELVKDRFTEREAIIQSEIEALDQKLESQKTYVANLKAAAVAEADGTGGSQRRNMGPIFRLKDEKAQEANSELALLTAEISPELIQKKLQLEEWRKEKATALQELESVPLTGFASRLKALGNLSAADNTIWIASLFITLLFILLETAPIFVKLISGKGPLDFVQQKHENKYSFSYQLNYDKWKAQQQYQKKTVGFLQAKSIEAENLLISELLEKEVENVRKEGLSWLNFQKWKQQIAGLFG